MDIQVINPSDLDKMFGEEPINPSDLNATTSTSDVKIIPEEKNPPILNANDGLGDIESLEDILAETEASEEILVEKDETLEKEETNPIKDDENDSAVLVDDKVENEETSEEISKALKNTADYLIESGIWEDFEGKDDLEWTNENYAKLAAQQEKHKIDKQFQTLVDQTGDYGKAIINHIKEGGDPDEILDLFKEQKKIESIDTDTSRGKLELLNNYYSDVLKWKPERVHKHLTRMVQNEEVDEEVSDIKERYEEYHASELQEVNQQREQTQRKIADQHRKFEDAIKTELEEGGYGSDERAFLQKSVLNLSNTIEGGTKVNDFYVKFAEMQKDPSEYLKLVHFVMDPEGYDKKRDQVTSSNSAKKAFEFIKGNSAVKKAATNKRPTPKNKKTNDLDWSPLF